MSTVSYKIANAIKEGKYPEDNIVCIVRYENSFNGNFAYKIIPEYKLTQEYIHYILYLCDALICPEIWWVREDYKHLF